ncbi:MAG: hypothetical protein GY842_17800 [bacterium]|nr:hypothetical protein [bacterium]
MRYSSPLLLTVLVVLLSVPAAEGRPGEEGSGTGHGAPVIVVEPGPTLPSVLYANGSQVEVSTSTRVRYICGSNTTGLTAENLRQDYLAVREIFENGEGIQVISGGGPRAGLNLVFNVTSGLPAGAQDALDEVATQIETILSDNVTVTIDFSMTSMGSNPLGWTASEYVDAVPWNTARTGLINGMDANDIIHDYLPTPTIPVRYDAGTCTPTDVDRCNFTKANYRATIGTVTGLAATMVMNTDFTWDYDPSNGVSGYCFKSTLFHEVGHALGFTSRADHDPNGQIDSLDIFRFQTSGGACNGDPGTYAEFETTARLVDYNNPPLNDHMSDLIVVEYEMSDGSPYQASHFRKRNPAIGIMDPDGAPGETFYPDFFMASDLDMFDAIGWDYIGDDCNDNGVPDDVDIAGATSDDCNSNAVPDECEPQDDCQPNGFLDICDIAVGTSLDCNDNRTPDECELVGNDCNNNGTPDDCEVASQDCNENGVIDSCDIVGATSVDCTGNGTPDECETDCNANGVRDDCDIAQGTSFDCQSNGTPDDCESDCDGNGTPDICDVPPPGGICVGQDCLVDCNTNGYPDSCDITRCTSLWDGFQPNPPFSRNTLIDTIDYIPVPGGDGVFWSNPEQTTIVDRRGCDTGLSSDLAVKVSVNESLPDPRDGYVSSEYFQEYDGGFAAEERVYDLSFSVKVELAIDSKWDWEFFIHDAVAAQPIAQLLFSSTQSLAVDPADRGYVLVKNPAGSPEYLNTGVTVFLSSCIDLRVVADNSADSVRVYVNDDLKVVTTPLVAGTRRMDYLQMQPASNNAATATLTELKLDEVELCLTGLGVPPEEFPDCNTNEVWDDCDLDQGTSADCNSNGIPDECGVVDHGDFDGDSDVDLTDYETFQDCFTGSCLAPPCDPTLYVGPCCIVGDADNDGDIDLGDFRAFQVAFTG